jgi:molybdopterin converting factor small subunit
MSQDTKEEVYTSPEEEVEALEQKLADKKKELEERGEKIPEERDMFREILREHIQKSRTPARPTPTTTPAPLPLHLQKTGDDLKKKEEREEQVRHLIELALTRTIQDAVKVAEAATPFLLDELHDHLTDDYYEKLIALRKIKAI